MSNDDTTMRETENDWMTWLWYQNTNEIRYVIYVHSCSHIANVLFRIRFSSLFSFFFWKFIVVRRRSQQLYHFVKHLLLNEECEMSRLNIRKHASFQNSRLTERLLYLTHNCFTILTGWLNHSNWIEWKLTFHYKRRLSIWMKSFWLIFENVSHLKFFHFRT